jgi:enolase
MNLITSITGKEILDSRGNPTVLAEVEVDKKITAQASVPSGASTGSREAVELRDGDINRYKGKGVLKAIQNINSTISKNLVGFDVLKQDEIDQIMIDIDGTEKKKNLGANAMLAVSLAVLKASSVTIGLNLFERIAQLENDKIPSILPVPMLNILNGGAHAIGSTDFQEFMIVPAGIDTFSESLRAGSEIYHSLGMILEREKLSTNVGFEGGFAPEGLTSDQVLSLIIEAIEDANYIAGEQIFIALDPAATEFHSKKSNLYHLQKENKNLSSEGMIEEYSKLIDKYPIYSIEDGLSEDDWDGWKKFTEIAGNNTQLVGDDLFVTQEKYLYQGINNDTANAILIKFNQSGTVSETLNTIKLAKKYNYNCVISHRSGETEDTTIADLSVGTNAGQIKTGAPARSERVAKYNRLLKIEDILGNKAEYAGKSILR